jgi:PEGA domain
MKKAGYDVAIMSSNRRWIPLAGLLVVFLSVVLPSFAKDAPLQVIDWPETGTPVLRFTFSKFKTLPSMGALHGYVMDTTAENLSSRLIPSARFSIYLFDKNKVRVGEDAIAVTNVGPGETVKFETTVSASGQPVSITLHELTQAARTVSLTINSTPQGAMLSVDGSEAGTTPRLITVGAGHHTLSFAKEGFNHGSFPLDISQNDVSGGSVTFELGAASYDSIELRDGSVLNGDLVSISGMDVEVRVGGSIQHIDRNKVKRVLLVQRDAPKPDPLPPASTNQ